MACNGRVHLRWFESGSRCSGQCLGASSVTCGRVAQSNEREDRRFSLALSVFLHLNCVHPQATSHLPIRLAIQSIWPVNSTSRYVLDASRSRVLGPSSDGTTSSDAARLLDFEASSTSTASTTPPRALFSPPPRPHHLLSRACSTPTSTVVLSGLEIPQTRCFLLHLLARPAASFAACIYMLIPFNIRITNASCREPASISIADTLSHIHA